jgi:hypothetical protein
MTGYTRFTAYRSAAAGWSVRLYRDDLFLEVIASFETDEDRARSLAADLNSTLVSHVERFAADQHRRSTTPPQQEP